MNKERISTTIDLVLLIFFTISSVFLCVQIYVVDFLDLFGQITVFIVLCFVLVLMFISKIPLWIRRVIMIGLSCCLIYSTFYISQYNQKRNQSEENIKTYYRLNLVNTSHDVNDPSKIEQVGVLMNDQYHIQSFEDINEAFQMEECEIKEYSNMNNLIHALNENVIQGMILSDHNLAILKQRFPELESSIQVLNENVHEVNISHVAKEIPMDQSFSILISINDNNKALDYVSFSSQCLILLVDPIENLIQTIQIPNDLYIPNVAYDSYPDALYNVSYNGIDNLLYALESTFDIQIDYFIKTNPTSIINTVDILQGITLSNKICDQKTCTVIQEYFNEEKIADYYYQTFDLSSIIEGIFHKRHELIGAKLLNFNNNYTNNSFTNLSIHKMKDYIQLIQNEDWKIERIYIHDLIQSKQPCISYGMNTKHDVTILNEQTILDIYSYFMRTKHLEKLNQFEFNLNQMKDGTMVPKSNEKLITTKNMGWKIQNYFSFLPYSSIDPIIVEKWETSLDFDHPNFDPEAPIQNMK